MIRIKNLTKDYGANRGVFDLSFEVQDAETFGLLGLRGAGKTTVGKELVKKGFELIDTDAYIEACEKMSISDIFAQKGEDYFRQAETIALKTLLAQDKQFVISCGGGMPLREENRKLLKELGMVVYLRIKPETVLARLKGDTTRPLLKVDDSGERVRTLMQQREAHYLSGADFVLDVDQKTPEELAEEIFKEF